MLFRSVSQSRYPGGLSQEIVFEEVVSTANVSAAGQPLATLAGKGRLDNQRNGGEVNFRASEMGMLMIFASIKPRVDYTQGNDWSYKLESIDDLHKPEFDQIGFQNLDAEQMHWLNAAQRDDGSWLTQTVGKQPAWMNYRTNVNRARGNFAIGYEGADSEQFMILARNYGWLPAPDGWFEMADPTTYIDPVKFNQAFAQTDLNAQNFWMQYGIDLEVTRIMNPRLMPNM